ncbi:uncharacterized protein LOC126412891 [Schistocerca serialis cubense]|uniref:uncharacterized protein LOC126412891 n=1 Tax=Schistocerca serialis cubense TaxID=2023355 RepID=UPI00214E2BBA|nr:uncharacterized protein LOC126412891 [Schistocerca serialis cubense]
MAALLALVPLLCVAAVVGVPSCLLPPASEEQLNIPTARMDRYVQFQYEAPDIQRLGCYVLTQSPGENPYELNINGSFTRQPDFPVSAKVEFKGNRMIKVYEGKWDKEFSGEYNVVYGDKDIFIDHFCYLGHEMAQIFTTEKKPSAELLERIWKVVEEHPEVEKSKFKEVVC